MPTISPQMRRGLRVLIVEDETRLRDLLLDVIPDMGFAASAARTAEDALRMMAEDPCQIILLDLRLPVMNGLEFFQHVRSRWPDTQVVIMTGHGNLESARKAIHLDVVDFLTKPCPLKSIEQSLDRARLRVNSASTVIPTDPCAEPNTPPPEAMASMTLEESERKQILASLARNDGNRTAAALELGISRRMLHYRLSDYQKKGFLG